MKQFFLMGGLMAAMLPVHAQVGLSGVFNSNTAARTVQEGFGNRNQTVKNKPFSATEERHSLQVLGDGTRIENSQTNRLFRDGEGRTRVEEANGMVSIYDPTTRMQFELNPANKTAVKGNGPRAFFYSTGDGLFSTEAGWQVTQPSSVNMKGVMAETTENLPVQAVNGVMAQGIRTTMTIPKGQIGNNRDIKVMTERWFSNDLQMLVKSQNSDPRFGETTYQLTKVTQAEPDASLFQIPAGYTVTEGNGPRPALSVGGRSASPGAKVVPQRAQ